MADSKRNFVIAKPADRAQTVKAGALRMNCKISWSAKMPTEKSQSLSRAQMYVDQECIRRMANDTPLRTGTLRNAATTGTVIGSGTIHQNTPYARRQYYEHKEKSRWFERMANRDKDVILKGAQRIAAGK
jgi:hypothetical protein